MDPTSPATASDGLRHSSLTVDSNEGVRIHRHGLGDVSLRNGASGLGWLGLKTLFSK